MDNQSMVSRRTLRKMAKEASSLIEAGILTPDAPEKIAACRNAMPKKIRFSVRQLLSGLLIFVSGALFLGGIILLAWHHWPEFSPEVRSLFGVFPLLLVGAFAFWSIRPGPALIRETGGTLLALAFSALLIVIRDNTQLNWNATDILRETALIGLIVAIVFDSLAAAALLTLEIIAILLWEAELLPAFWFPAALLVYLIYRIAAGKKYGIVSSQIAGGLILLLAGFSALDFLREEPGIDGTTLFSLLSSCVFFAGIAFSRRWGPYNVFSVSGEAAFLTCLTLAGFHPVWKEHFLWDPSAESRALTWWVTLALAALFFSLLYFAVRLIRREKKSWTRAIFAALLLLLPIIGFLHATAGILFSLFLLGAYVFCLLRRGVRKSSVLTVSYAAVIVIVLLVLHFFLPGELTRDQMGWIYLSGCLLAVIFLTAMKFFFPHKKDGRAGNDETN